ncbi:MAG: hypothetical protein KF764_09830 [Labilithrix sp.]|nr:hypothetical protein [Labilithrix sp.]
MTTPDDDRELRQRFQELARYDRARAPDFEKMWAARPSRARSPWRLVVPAASLAAAAVLVLWCGTTSLLGESSPEASAPAAAAAAPAAAPAPEPLAGEVAASAETSPRAIGAYDPAPLDFLLAVPGSARALSASGFDSNPLQGW